MKDSVYSFGKLALPLDVGGNGEAPRAGAAAVVTSIPTTGSQKEDDDIAEAVKESLAPVSPTKALFFLYIMSSPIRIQPICLSNLFEMELKNTGRIPFVNDDFDL